MVHSVSGFTRLPFPQEELSSQETTLLQTLQTLKATINTSEDPSSLIPQVEELLHQIQHLPLSAASSSGNRPQKDFLEKEAKKLLSLCNESKQSESFLLRLPNDIIGHIVQHIPVEGIKGFEGTCRRSHRIVNEILSRYLDICKETLALSKKNLEAITTLELDHDPYAIVRPEDRDLPFQDIMRDIQATYQKQFPGKTPSLRYILTKLPSYTISPDELENVRKKVTKLVPPYFEKEYFLSFLQTIESVRQGNYSYDYSSSHKEIFLIKYLSLLASTVENEDPISFQCFINDIQTAVHSSAFSKRMGVEYKEMLTKIYEWNPSELIIRAKKFHDFLCTLFRIPDLEPLLLELKDGIEIIIRKLQNFKDFHAYFIMFLSHSENLQIRFLSFSILYGAIQAHLKQTASTNPHFKEIYLNLHCLQAHVRKLIPPDFPLLEIAKAFETSLDISDYSIFHLFECMPEQQVLLNTEHEPTLLHFRKIYPASAYLYFDREVFCHAKRIALFSETCLFLFKNNPSLLFPFSFFDQTPSLAYLATHPQTQRIFLSSPTNNLAHIPFLLPQLTHFQPPEDCEETPPLPVPSTFQYFGPTLTILEGFDDRDLPPSFSTSQSPTIQNRLQIESQRRKIQKIAHRTLVKMSYIALSIVAGFFLVKRFTK